jgi:hypothetical protein
MVIDISMSRPAAYLTRLSTQSDRSALFISATFFALYYAPWLRKDLRIATVHDLLDSSLVHNFILGKFFAGEIDYQKLLLNGQVPVTSLATMCQPLSLLFAFFEPSVAYILIDVIVRLVAFAGIYLLANHVKVSPGISSALAICFATSLSYSNFLLSVAGIPIVIWLVINSKKFSSFRYYLGLVAAFLLGANISLVLSGIFLMVLIIPIIKFGFSVDLSKRNILMILSIFVGILLGNANLLYLFFFDKTKWHREEFARIESYNFSSFDGLIKAGKESFLGFTYHVSYTPLFLYLAVLIILFCCIGNFPPDLRSFYLLLSAIQLVYGLSQLGLTDGLEKHFSIMRSFQWDRFYFLSTSLIFFILILFYSKQKKLDATGFLIFLLVLTQIFLNLGKTPHLRSVGQILLHKQVNESIDSYYLRSDYARIKSIVNSSPVISIGLDPMIAPMNEVVSIDGYYTLYPLSYKNEFRDIIRKSILPTGKSDYFEKWGSRLYVFYNDINSVDFCSAYSLGARFVISKVSIQNDLLLLVAHPSSDFTVYLYRILGEDCSTPKRNESINTNSFSGKLGEK